MLGFSHVFMSLEFAPQASMVPHKEPLPLDCMPLASHKKRFVKWSPPGVFNNRSLAARHSLGNLPRLPFVLPTLLRLNPQQRWIT